METVGVSNGTDDTAALNALLAANRIVKGHPGQTYLISAPLVVPSNTTLDMTGATVSLKAASLCNMVQSGVAAQRTVTDGAIDIGVSTTTLNSATANFVTADIGRTVNVPNAGTSGAPITARITARISATAVTIDTPATTTVTGATVSIFDRTTNVRIIGGTWDRTNNGGTFLTAHTMLLRHIDGLVVERPTIITTTGKFAISIGDCTNFDVNGPTFATSSDGVHIAGPSSKGTIRNIFGTTGDDSVAFTPQDWPNYNDTAGDITDVDVSNVFTTATNAHPVRLMGSVGSSLMRINVRNVFAASSGGSGMVWIGEGGSANTTGGFIDLITVENLSPKAYTTPALFMNGTNIGRVTVNGIYWDSTAAVTPVSIAPASATTYNRLVIKNVVCKSLGTAFFWSTVNGAIRTLIIDTISVVTPPASTTAIANIWGAVTNLTVTNLDMAGGNGGQAINIAVPVTNVIVDKATLVGTGLCHLLNYATNGTSTDTTINSAHVNNGTGSILKLAGTTSTVTRATLSNIHQVSTGGGSMVSATTSTMVLPNVEMDGCTITGSSWLVDLATTTELHLNGVTHKAQINGSINVRATAVITVRGDGNLIGGNPAVAGGGLLNVKSFGFQTDITNIVKGANDMAYNTNAALSCGAGPVVCNGTSWKHLYTGTVYP